MLKAEKRRVSETVVMIGVTILLLALSRLETYLYQLSQKIAQSAEAFASVIFFVVINLNVICILVLSSIIFRNTAKLVMERRHGVFGSSLTAKLVAVFVFFAVGPTILTFYISTLTISSSYQNWISANMRQTIEEARQVGETLYLQDQKRLESVAKIAVEKLIIEQGFGRFPGDIPTVRFEYLPRIAKELQLEYLVVFDRDGRRLWEGGERDIAPDVSIDDVFLLMEKLESGPRVPSLGSLVVDEDYDAVRGVAPIRYNHELIGILIVQQHLESRVLRSVENIMQRMYTLKPSAELNRFSNVILLLVVVVVIVFAMSWLAFFVARRITSPLQELAAATLEVSQGNYRIRLEEAESDETGALVRAFNRMTEDLLKHESDSKSFTERLQTTNQELVKRQNYMEVVLKNITSGVISVDANHCITSMNTAAERLLEITSTMSIGKVIDEVLDSQTREELWQPVKESLSKGGTFYSEVSCTRGNLKLLVAGIRIYDASGKDLGAVMVFDDATEQARAQRVAAWREVARRVAHEIKNPITPIQLNAQRLLRKFSQDFKGEDREVFDSCLNSILMQVNTLKRLVDEFSEFSRLPAHRPLSQSLNKLIEAFLASSLSSYPSLLVEKSLDPALPLLGLDQAQLERVLSNLILNAVEAMKEVDKPRLFISTKWDLLKRVARLTVEDNGPGIPGRLKDRVIEPYFSTKTGGTGLGLAIVRQMVIDHRGDVKIAESRWGGTSIIIELPADDLSLVT